MSLSTLKILNTKIKARESIVREKNQEDINFI